MHGLLTPSTTSRSGSPVSPILPCTPANANAFSTTWQVRATAKNEVTAIQADAPDLARWWPSVYLEVREVTSGDERGVGKVVELYTKGLPYPLRWRFEVTESIPHNLRRR